MNKREKYNFRIFFYQKNDSTVKHIKVRYLNILKVKKTRIVNEEKTNSSKNFKID